MGELTVTGLDEAVLAKLSRRAAEHGRTVEAEATDILLQELGVQQTTATSDDPVWAKMAESRKRTGAIGISTIDLLREIREGEEFDGCG